MFINNFLISTFIHRYRDRSLQLKTPKLQKLFKKKIYTISIYAQEIVEALWYDEVCKYFISVISIIKKYNFKIFVQK